MLSYGKPFNEMTLLIPLFVYTIHILFHSNLVLTSIAWTLDSHYHHPTEAMKDIIRLILFHLRVMINIRPCGLIGYV